MPTTTRPRRTQRAKRAGASGAWPHKHLLALQDLPPEDLRTLLSATRVYVEAGGDPSRAFSPPGRPAPLHGRSVATIFFEDSTRTRASFTLAAQRLGADVVDLSAGSSVSKGETLVDTALNIEAMGVDALVVRDSASGAAAMIASAVDCCVLNAGDGRHEHPTQGLLDAYTVCEAFGRLGSWRMDGLSVAIVGDIAGSRVARSDVAAFRKLGAEVVCVGPPSLCPSSVAALGCRVTHDLDSVLYDVDACIMLRIQLERGTAVASLREYAEFFQLSEQRAARMKPGARVMHPGPMNRGVEIATPVADGPRSLVLRQAAVGVGVRMAALELCVRARSAKTAEQQISKAAKRS